MELIGNYKIEKKNYSYKFTTSKVVCWSLINEVFKISGDHLESSTEEDVSEASFINQLIFYFPRNLGIFFPNLQVLTLYSCGIKRISKFDLHGLRRLKEISLNGNHLVTLPNNLFESTPEIESVSFCRNKIKYIGPNIFDSLDNLRYANFKLNKNIDIVFKVDGKGPTLEEMKAYIAEFCQEIFHGQVNNYFDNLKGIFGKTFTARHSWSEPMESYMDFY
ncbi:CLUMA_CG008200, isoform A [Clunio marinus]|uniref:CLUMA_CG008200, isoform A n=1 Tax=Clunio marinus TaxID=568069 RepID=A0A1J1I531_9DIPT|nr:CLUMA_CG008200, isoform A [Clunio marinus]